MTHWAQFNEILSVIDILLFQAVSSGSPKVQQREIAIADLQVKIVEIENQRAKLAEEIREKVILQMLDFDTIRREFQIAQKVMKRVTLRLQILEQNYHFAVHRGLTTPEYLRKINLLDRQKVDPFRAWSRCGTVGESQNPGVRKCVGVRTKFNRDPPTHLFLD